MFSKFDKIRLMLAAESGLSLEDAKIAFSDSKLLAANNGDPRTFAAWEAKVRSPAPALAHAA